MMQISDSLEVAIGLSFIFFLASIVLASIHEMLETVFKARGIYLYDGIVQLFTGSGTETRTSDDLAKEIYRHPLIEGLVKGTVDAPSFARNKPSYLPTRNFALALIDQAAKGKLGTGAAMPPPSALPAVAQLRLRIEGIDNEQLRGALAHAIDSAAGDMDRVTANIEKWFDGAMDRVSGWYKRRSQRIVFALGLVVAFGLNVNTIVVAEALSTSSSVRHAIVSIAAEETAICRADATKCRLGSDAVTRLDATMTPIGWTAAAQNALVPFTASVGGWLELLTGYLLTAFAVTLGAPFWFDILNRLMIIRATVKPAEKSKEEAPRDPQREPTVIRILTTEDKETATPAIPAAGAIDADILAERNPVPLASAERLFEADDGTTITALTADAATAMGGFVTSAASNLADHSDTPTGSDVS